MTSDPKQKDEYSTLDDTGGGNPPPKKPPGDETPPEPLTQPKEGEAS